MEERRDKPADAAELRRLAEERLKARSPNSRPGKAPDDWKLLHGLCSDLVALRKGDHSAERLKLDRERLLIGY